MSPPPMSDAEVIRALERLAKRWPPDLILFGGPHTLALLRRTTYHVVRHFSIPADGGDPGDLPYEGENEEEERDA